MLGLILSVVMGAANVYVGLKAGMTVSASIPAAVMAMLVFRLFFRRSSILEANQVQTCASAGESLAAGIIFTMPALVLIGYWESFDFWTVSMVALTGGLLGILFMIPMRRVFVVNNDELPYPEGIACAAVLESGEEDGAHHEAAKGLILGGLLGGLFKVCNGFLGLIAGTLETAQVGRFAGLLLWRRSLADVGRRRLYRPVECGGSDLYRWCDGLVDRDPAAQPAASRSPIPWRGPKRFGRVKSATSAWGRW